MGYSGGVSEKSDSERRGFGAFQGVYTPSILTIIGVVLYLRFGWVLGNLGLWKTLLMVTGCSSVTFLTALSLSALATNRRVAGGGAYHMVSRCFGAELGAAVGIPLFLAQAIGTAFYVAGFTEAFLGTVALPGWAAGWVSARGMGLLVLAVIAVLSLVSAKAALRAQYVIMAAIAVSLVSFFAGGTPGAEALAGPAGVVAERGDFWKVLAVFFPAVTGILAGVGMSGDLRDPGRALPLGTVGAVLTGYVIYMCVPVVLQLRAGGAPALLTDPLIFQKCARWQGAVSVGVWAACLSSALGSLLAAPRVVQAMARDRLLPEVLGRGGGATDEPRAATLLTLMVAGAFVWSGGVNFLAQLLTMVHLVVYALLNLAAGLEEWMGSASWRPRFRVPVWVSFAGVGLSSATMLMISPGTTLVAVALFAVLYAATVRRRVQARWGDFRRGLLMQLVRGSMRLLAEGEDDGRNWRPNVLVFAGSPGRNPLALRVGDAVTRGRGLLTVATVVPSDHAGAARARNLRRTLRGWLEKQGTEAFARVVPASTPWEGMRELVRAYGFGPMAPNTMVAGVPKRDSLASELASVTACATERKVNLVLVTGDGDGEIASARRIDVWWRGKGTNALFLLALAWLVRRAGRGEREATIRLCHVLEKGEDDAGARRSLEQFLSRSRVDAVIRIVQANGRPPSLAIRQESHDAGLVLLGLRARGEGESDEAFGRYLMGCRRSVKGLPQVAFALAAQDVDFRGLFE